MTKTAVGTPDREPRKNECSVEGCDKSASSRGWCPTHYSRWRRTGDVGPAGLIAQRGRVCQILGCGKQHAALGLCYMHWDRRRKHGDVGPAESIKRPGRPCGQGGCERPHEARGLCRLHYNRWRKHGDPQRVERHAPGPASHKWQGDEIAYRTAHARVQRMRGLASSHPCEHCGGHGRDWAYDHADPAERLDSRTGSPYSADPRHYMPLCGSCHQRFDNTHRKEVP